MSDVMRDEYEYDVCTTLARPRYLHAKHLQAIHGNGMCDE